MRHAATYPEAAGLFVGVARAGGSWREGGEGGTSPVAHACASKKRGGGGLWIEDFFFW